jgi:hypothetical protein
MIRAYPSLRGNTTHPFIASLDLVRISQTDC